MELPPLNSIEGAYWYLISGIVLLAVVAGAYAAAVATGLAPDPASLV